MAYGIADICVAPLQVVYSIFGLPLLLLVVLPFALCGSCKPKTEAVTKKAGGKKKGASKARA